VGCRKTASIGHIIAAAGIHTSMHDLGAADDLLASGSTWASSEDKNSILLNCYVDDEISDEAISHPRQLSHHCTSCQIDPGPTVQRLDVP
jgi:hypothetical protein